MSGSNVYESISGDVTFIPLVTPFNFNAWHFQQSAKIENCLFVVKANIALSANWAKFELRNTGRDGTGSDVITSYTNNSGDPFAFAADQYVMYELPLAVANRYVGEGDILKIYFTGAGAGNYPFNDFFMALMINFII